MSPDIVELLLECKIAHWHLVGKNSYSTVQRFQMVQTMPSRHVKGREVVSSEKYGEATGRGMIWLVLEVSIGFCIQLWLAYWFTFNGIFSNWCLYLKYALLVSKLFKFLNMPKL